ncbi:MAG: phosphoribosylformylglycinamidine cyclo-ligase [bacterium]
MANKEQITYKDAGVDIEAGYEAVKKMRSAVKSTFNAGVLADIGGFGGLFALDKEAYEEPVLVSGTDGVGTKLRLAFLQDKHDTIGIDAVAMCVNDIVVQGAKPLFFLDYLAVGKLVPDKVADIVKGVAEGCRQAGAALVGGETAEMPGFYPVDEYDVAGFAVGVVDKKKIINGQTIKPGDQLIGIASSGVHSNGFSLVRKVLLEVAKLSLDEYNADLGKTLGEELLTPTKIYVKTVLALLERYNLKGLAHITGGGLIENVPRALPAGVQAEIKSGSWDVLPVFKLIQEKGNIPWEEMLKTFNLGIGMVLVVAPEDKDDIMRELELLGEKAYHIGEIKAGEDKIKVI